MKKEEHTALVVEDEPLVREYISDLLKKNRFNVLEAGDGQEACKIYEENEHLIDVIVSDLLMPNMSGSDFAEFNYEKRFFPFVACTAIEDAKVSLRLLDYGVRDYIVKPIDDEAFVVIVRNAIDRRRLSSYVEDDENPYAGNIGSVTIPSKRAEIRRVEKWIESRLDTKIRISELARLMNYVHEFLLNAYEHGNLRISEQEKHELLVMGKYYEEVDKREKNCNANIKVDLSVLEHEVSIKITDDGYGFDHAQYLNMTDERILERLEMPNGRGVNMSTRYFDSITYVKGGASVLLNKKFA